MTARVRAWLPPGAATGPRVRDALEGAVDAWAGRWFAGARLSLAALELRSAGAPRLGNGWLCHGGAVAVPADGPEAIRLAGLALGADAEDLILSEPDRDILGGLAATILADLATTLAAALGQAAGGEEAASAEADPLAGEAGVVLRIEDARGRPLTQAAITFAALVPFLKAGIPVRPGPALPRLDRAIGRTSTRLDVRLGRTRLSLGDLVGLAAGDVLVLDRTVADGAVLALAGGGAIARGMVAADGDVTCLTLAPETESARA